MQEVHDTAPPELPLQALISALLFASGRPLSTDSIAEAVSHDSEVVEQVLQDIQTRFSDAVDGFSLQKIADGWQFRTAQGAWETIRELVSKRGRRLSRAASETLAVIAYKQPVQRAEIDSIRGVDTLPTIRTLLDAKLIRVIGKESAPGQPTLYGTTKLFLERFGLSDLNDLPSVKELQKLADEPGEPEEEDEEEASEAFAEVSG